MDATATAPPKASRTETATDATPVRFPYQHVNTASEPPALDLEALKILGSVRGESVVQEAESAIQVLDDHLRAMCSHMTSLQGIREAFAAAPGVLSKRATYRARVAAWRRQFGLGASAIADPLPLPRLDPGQLHAHATSHLAIKATRAREALDKLDREIADYAQGVTDDHLYGCQKEPIDESTGSIRGTPSHPQDACLGRLSRWCDERRKLQASVAALEGDAAQALAVVVAHVRKAVELGGGIEAVRAGAIAAAALQSPPQEWAGIEGRLAEAQKAKRKLLAAGITGGPAHATAQGQADAAAAELSAAQAAWVVTRRTIAAGLVERAISGDEGSRATLEQLGAASPAAFAPGFSQAMASARYDLAVLADISAAVGSL